MNLKKKQKHALAKTNIKLQNPGFVVFYDIQLGNGAVQFSQAQSLHWAKKLWHKNSIKYSVLVFSVTLRSLQVLAVPKIVSSIRLFSKVGNIVSDCCSN